VPVTAQCTRRRARAQALDQRDFAEAPCRYSLERTLAMSAAATPTEERDEDFVFVIDDFLPDANALRELGLEADYPAPPVPETYAGRHSARTYPLPGIDARIEEITQRPVRPVPFPAAHSRFRLCLAHETGTGGVHIDNCHWTGVLYLSRDEHAQGGTDFFRHRPSGTLRAPVYPEDWAAWGGRTIQQLWKEVILPHTNDASKWDLVRHVPMQFNRLVLFRPWLWHNATPGFGDGVADGRLIYLFVYHDV
jgi:hypothetical protein